MKTPQSCPFSWVGRCYIPNNIFVHENGAFHYCGKHCYPNSLLKKYSFTVTHNNLHL